MIAKWGNVSTALVWMFSRSITATCSNVCFNISLHEGSSWKSARGSRRGDRSIPSDRLTARSRLVMVMWCTRKCVGRQGSANLPTTQVEAQIQYLYLSNHTFWQVCSEADPSQIRNPLKCSWHVEKSKHRTEVWQIAVSWMGGRTPFFLWTFSDNGICL